VWTSAATYLYRAGAKAQAEARYGTAVTFYEASVDALQRLGDTADRNLELDAYLELWSTRISTGQIDGLGALGDKVEILARSLDDGSRLARVQVRQAQAIALAGAIPGTLHRALERAREAATRADAADLRTRSYARFIAAVACRDMGRFEEAVEEFDIGVKLFATTAEGHEPGLVYPIFVSLCGWRSEAEGALGRFDAGLASATEALRMATEIRHASSLSIANAFLGYLKLLQGDLEAAVVALTRGLAIAEEHDLMHGVCANGLYLAWASLLAGDRARGLEYLERGLERPAGAQLQWTRFGSVTAAVYLAAGCPDEARPIIARGLTDVTERDAHGYRGPLLRLEAELLLGDGDAATARTHAEEALALARELGTRPEAGWCHATLARITGSRVHLAAAQRTFGELGMTFWVERLGRLTL
jgi:tetratricopeptide (TPR) repeat protein